MSKIIDNLIYRIYLQNIENLELLHSIDVNLKFLVSKLSNVKEITKEKIVTDDDWSHGIWRGATGCD